MGTWINITCIGGQLLNSTHPINIEYVYLILYHSFWSLIMTIEQYISNSDDFLAVYYTCEDCDSTLLTYLVNALGCFSSILLNNYSKIHMDKLGSAKQSNKLSKLN